MCIQIAETAKCDRDVYNKHDHQYRKENIAHKRSQKVKKAEKTRLGQSAYPYAAGTKKDSAIQADSAIEIKREMGVVPPAGMEQFFHGVTGHIFEDRADDRGREKQRERTVDFMK